MTETGATCTRTLRLRFHSPDGTAIREALGALSPQPELRPSGRELEIDYPFPSLSMVEIWQALAVSGAADQLRAGSRLHCQARAFLEENERDRLLAPRGWRYHAREIHAQYFERRRLRAGDAQRQQWRKHEKWAAG